MNEAQGQMGMGKWVKVVAGVVVAIAAVLLAYALLTPDATTDDTDHMGMNGRMVYSSTDVGLIGIALVMIVAAIMIVVLWQEYEPLPPNMVPPSKRKEEPGGSAETVVVSHPPTPANAGKPTEEEEPGRNYLVLRLLTGDERTMFKTIMDTGGEALQKDLISRTKMSNAKVSRVLDRLSQKGVITKERYGATNKVRIKLER